MINRALVVAGPIADVEAFEGDVLRAAAPSASTAHQKGRSRSGSLAYQTGIAVAATVASACLHDRPSSSAGEDAPAFRI